MSSASLQFWFEFVVSGEELFWGHDRLEEALTRHREHA
jgi:2-hydroxychromene-2-carboxylate isomerase